MAVTFVRPFHESTLCTFVMSSLPVKMLKSPVFELLNYNKKKTKTGFSISFSKLFWILNLF